MEQNKENLRDRQGKAPHFTDVFLTERDKNGKRFIATWVYSVLLLLSLLISILTIPALSKSRDDGQKIINLQLEGTSKVNVQVGPKGINLIEISQPKQTKNTTPNEDFEGESSSRTKDTEQFAQDPSNSKLNAAAPLNTSCNSMPTGAPFASQKKP